MRQQISSAFQKTFSEIIIPEMYCRVREEVKSNLKNAEMVAITTDGWSSRASESYMTVTSSHISDDWQMKNFVLQTRALPESHTGDHIAEVLQEAVNEWNISTQNIYPYNPPLVTDNASNMVKAGQSFNTKLHVMCYAHTINLAAQKCLKVARVAHLLSRMRKIVAFFHRSNIASHLLKTKAECLGLPGHKLLIDVCTRWNSAYDMISRFLEMQVAVFAVLRSKELGREKDTGMKSFSDEDLSLAEELLVVLKPLKDITTMLCTEQTPTVSLIMPLQKKLIKQAFVTQEVDSPSVKEMKILLKESLESRYTDKEQILNMCTALDPRFKQLPYLTEEERAVVFSDLKNEVARIHTIVKVKVEDTGLSVTEPELPSLHTLPEEEAPPPKQIKTEGKSSSLLGDIFGDVYICGSEPAKSPADIAETQIVQYKEIPSIGVDEENPLLWWRRNEHQFPGVARLAKMMLGIPATSVPSERVFSSAGNILSAQRANLKSKHVDKLIFLKKNMD